MFMAPMLMSKHEEPFDDSEYIFEPMIDGHRLLLSFIGSKARLYTKHHNDVTRQYPGCLKFRFEGRLMLFWTGKWLILIRLLEWSSSRR